MSLEGITEAKGGEILRIIVDEELAKRKEVKELFARYGWALTGSLQEAFEIIQRGLRLRVLGPVGERHYEIMVHTGPCAPTLVEVHAQVIRPGMRPKMRQLAMEP